MKKVLSFLYFFICAMLLFSVSALAYIDPAAMTFMIQIFAGLAIAIGATFGLYYRKIRRFFRKLFNKDGAAVDNWEYDENDDDQTGYDDYPILEGVDAVWPEESQNATEEAFDGEIVFEVTDKYDERGGYTPEKEIVMLRKLLAAEKAKNAKLNKTKLKRK